VRSSCERLGDGYKICQEYLPAAQQGDTRLFVMNGEPLRYKRRYAAFRRVRRGDDMRSNIHAGGKLARSEIGESHLAEIVLPKLTQDGMFLVGLDIVGDKLMEINGCEHCSTRTSRARSHDGAQPRLPRADRAQTFSVSSARKRKK
jgi:glutathione synthase/RimK-type ligase-like ATP-grasp enzyme